MTGVILYNNELKWKSTLKHRNIEFSSVYKNFKTILEKICKK